MPPPSRWHRGHRLRGRTSRRAVHRTYVAGLFCELGNEHCGSVHAPGGVGFDVGEAVGVADAGSGEVCVSCRHPAGDGDAGDVMDSGSSLMPGFEDGSNSRCRSLVSADVASDHYLLVDDVSTTCHLSSGDGPVSLSR